MRSFLSKGRFRAADATDRAVEAYEVVWGAEKPSLGQFWDGLGASRSISTLAALVKVDLGRRFELGERPRAAEYLEKFPDLTASGDRVVSLVYEEFCLRLEAGEAPDSKDFCDAYGPWRDSLLSQLAYHRQLSQAVGADLTLVKFPEPGDRFEKYRIRSLLGTGGVARVYLATEEDLGGRKVALKVSASFGQEPSILAKLDHRNIVPILTVAESDSGLRGFCMPYRPGVTLEDLIRKLGRGTPPRSARALWKLLTPSGSPADLGPVDQRAGWAGFPIKGTFSEGVAWIGLALSNALSYLHGEEVLHRDIKPANVLLAYREGPQLLDFNLAQNPTAPEQARAAFKGGTLPYMAPEHLRAFIDPSGWDDVDSAADIYSLGLVLRELATGRPPELPSTNLSLPRGIQSLIDRRGEPMLPIREFNPNVPPALESIISKCLAFDPAERYASGSDLADDLRRFLDREPLGHAPNTSTIERGVNFIYRNRYIAIGSVLLLIVLSVVKLVSTPTPVHKLSRFQRAVAGLNSKRPGDWERARIDFEHLRKDHPGSAWPLLYLGLIHEKIGGRNRLAEASRSIDEAIRCPDAEDAISERLKTDPRSATVLTAQGMILAKRKDIDRARAAFNLAIEADPDRIQSLLCLVNLEDGPQRNEKAIQVYTKAIESGEKRNTGSELLHELRRLILPHLAKRAESSIDSGRSARERDRAALDLDKIESTLEAMKDDLDRMMAVGGGQIRKFTEQFYLGLLASCRAVLAADQDDSMEASRLIEEARHHLAEALESIPEGVEDQLEFRSQTEAQQKKLEIRYLNFVAWREQAQLLAIDRR